MYPRNRTGTLDIHFQRSDLKEMEEISSKKKIMEVVGTEKHEEEEIEE